MPKHDHHWTFGDHCHIRFPGGGDPIFVGTHGFSSREGCATVSDSAGGLLFYTDGTTLFDGAHATIGSGLGGSPSSAHSAIIVPPAGGGSLYHIFAVFEWATGQVGPLTHTSVSVASGGAIAIASGPTPLTFGPKTAAEKLAAIPHRDCSKYWVISLNVDASDIAPGAGTFYAMLVDTDAGVSLTVPTAYPWPAWFGYCVKFSPDGSLVAIVSRESIDILSFDRGTGAIGAHSQITGITSQDITTGTAYGVEFSPNGQYLYFTRYQEGDLYRHTIGASTPFSSTVQIAQLPAQAGDDQIGALQLAPNGKIYGARPGQNRLFEIGDPDNATATATGVEFQMDAVQSDGTPLDLKDTVCRLGLPTFTRIADDCADDRCATIAAEVDEQIAGQELHNSMRPCRGEQVEPQCHPLDIPPIAPQTYIRWGSGPCDCIEGDDTEVMHLTVCNPYKNLTLSNLTIHQLVVVDANGNPVPNLPDGSPSIQLVPVGPHCFDDIAPCTCVSREFVLRLRGAPGGPYKILVRGICFDACLHGDTEACFTFEVCKD